MIPKFGRTDCGTGFVWRVDIEPPAPHVRSYHALVLSRPRVEEAVAAMLLFLKDTAPPSPEWLPADTDG